MVDSILDSPLRSDRLTRSRVVESKCPLERSALSRKSSATERLWRRNVDETVASRRTYLWSSEMAIDVLGLPECSWRKRLATRFPLSE